MNQLMNIYTLEKLEKNIKNIFLFMKKCENVTLIGERSLFRATYLEK